MAENKLADMSTEFAVKILNLTDVFNKHFKNGFAELPFVVNCYIGRLDT